jgi:O-antigen/teichoic acid export membrane protein
MAVAKKIAYNVALNSSIKVFSTVVLSLFSIRLITDYLGPEGFGMYATALAFFALFSAVIDLGLAPVTAREISREGAPEEEILGKVISLRLITSSILALVSPLFIYFFHYSQELKIGIFFVALATIFSTFSYVLNGVFQKRLIMDRIAFVELGGKLLQVVLLWLFIQAELGFLFIASTIFIALTFNALLAYFLSRRYVKIRLSLDHQFWKGFLKESLPMGITAIITFSYFKLDTILLSLWQPAAAVGIYNVAYKVMENLVFFPAMLAGLILPLLSRYIYTNRGYFEEIAGKTSKVFLVFVTPLVVGTWFLAGDIVQIISGGGFEGAVPVLKILILALACVFFGNYFNMLLVVSNAQKKLMVALFCIACTNIVINTYVIPKYSYIGAAYTSLFTELLVAIAGGILVYKHIGYVPSFEHIGRIFLSGAIMASSLYFLIGAPFLLAGIVSGGVYVLSLAAFRAVSLREMKSLLFSKTKEEVL